MAAAVRKRLSQREIQVTVAIEVCPLNAVIRRKQRAAFAQHVSELAVPVHEQVCARMGISPSTYAADEEVQESVVVGVAP